MRPAEAELWKELEPGAEYYISENARAWEAYEAHDVPRAEKIRESYQAEANRRFVEPLKKLRLLDATPSWRSRGRPRRPWPAPPRIMWAAMVLAVLAAIGLGWFISRRIAASIRHVIDESTRLGDGGGRRPARRAGRRAGRQRGVPAGPGEPEPDHGRLRDAHPGHRPGGGPDRPRRDPAAHHRDLPGRLQRDQGQPQPLHRRGQRPGGRRHPRWPRPAWPGSSPPAPTRPATRATSARSSRASTAPSTR